MVRGVGGVLPVGDRQQGSGVDGAAGRAVVRSALVSPSWRALVRRHGMYYAAFAMIFVAALVFLAMRRSWYAGGGIAVFEKISPIEYVLSEPGVIANYLRLSFWPVGQCFDYRWPIARTAGEIVPPLALIGVLVAATIGCVFGRPGWGFLGAPSS